LLQFLIDYNKENNAAQRPQTNIDGEEESDSDEELRGRCLKSKSYTDSNIPASVCRREVTQDGGHKAAMQSLGFPPALIERAVQELGQGVEYDMLLEYLLYLSAQQDPEASTSANPSSGGEDNTLEKLTTEFQFPAMAVEKAMGICSEKPCALCFLASSFP